MKSRLNIAGVAALALLVACRGNVAPSDPILVGPNRAWPGDSVTFRATSVDRDADQVSYQFSWADGSDTLWSPWMAPAADLYVHHAFPDTGVYPVQCRARDATRESGWSDTLAVQVAGFGPSTPRRPSGQDTAKVGRDYGYMTSASHPLQKPVSYRFEWGDTTGDWSEFEGSGGTYIARHVFGQPGLFAVRVQARDMRDHVSGWSPAETVLVVDTLALPGVQ